jgi:integrase
MAASLRECPLPTTEIPALPPPVLTADIDVISRHLAATGRTGANGEQPLFTSPEGKSLHSSNFRQRVFLKALEAADLQGVTFHDLRRTHATVLVAAGVDPKAIQQRLGHKDVVTTLKYYARPTDQGIAKAAEVMSNYLAEPSYASRVPIGL